MILCCSSGANCKALDDNILIAPSDLACSFFTIQALKFEQCGWDIYYLNFGRNLNFLPIWSNFSMFLQQNWIIFLQNGVLPSTHCTHFVPAPSHRERDSHFCVPSRWPVPGLYHAYWINGIGGFQGLPTIHVAIGLKSGASATAMKFFRPSYKKFSTLDLPCITFMIIVVVQKTATAISNR